MYDEAMSGMIKLNKIKEPIEYALAKTTKSIASKMISALSTLSNYEGNSATIIDITAGIGNNNNTSSNVPPAMMNEHGIINNSSSGIDSDLLNVV
jgi:hypothetical protein